ncbi:hypothetical protein N5E37_14550 [Acinetobacter johnsonii]|uniref:hypothetical protein n=1 Tax=Acinetobacter johnsonii TaxID=40214 RepID=UPI0024484E7E|nr:hypothetical protein [Acinetobacter johnsonii]MDH1727385.1 hypothetical protein [Acinetobacter johnsonii]
MIQIDARNITITWDLGRDITYEVLIENLGGYESAKSKFRDNGSLHAERLKKALLEYRRQHNIFEPDDYIIHDGELKVFAMWSSAVEGCAYIGYAYAENGEMAHKDEFRHATDAEIKAGKRLEVK